jgi:hypothetical protein
MAVRGEGGADGHCDGDGEVEVRMMGWGFVRFLRFFGIIGDAMGF